MSSTNDRADDDAGAPHRDEPHEPTVRLKGASVANSPASDATTDEDRDPPPPPGT